MYGRAPRVLSRPYGSTAPGVGPGSYHNAKKFDRGKFDSKHTSGWMYMQY